MCAVAVVPSVTFDGKSEAEKRSEEERRRAAADKSSGSSALGGVKGVGHRSGKNVSTYMRALREVEREELGGAVKISTPAAPVHLDATPSTLAPPSPRAPSPAPPSPRVATPEPAPTAPSVAVVDVNYPDPSVKKYPYEELRRRPRELPSDKVRNCL